MKKIMSKIILLLCVAYASTGAQAKIYSWVDKEGKKHFGQEVPKEYANKSKQLDVKPINSMDSTKVPALQPKVEPRSYLPPEQMPRNQPEPESENLSACEQQKRAYEASVSCFSRCRLDRDAHRTQVNNVASCNCADAKKPSC